MNIKVSYSPYQLRAQSALNALAYTEVREGVLLKIQWPDDGRIGYADLHPWHELGDASLENQLSELRMGKMSQQIEQCVWLADRDAKLRQQKKNIFDAGVAVKNNFLITSFEQATPGFLDQVQKDQFSTLKVKVGRALKGEAEFICRAASRGFRLRLDFNGSGSLATFQEFVDKLDPVAKQAIDYVEDPFPYDFKEWNQAHKLLPLALDNQFARVDWGNLKQAPFSVLIIKPAKMDINKSIQLCQLFQLRATVTSYMDHPIGMMHALGIAMNLKKEYPEMMNDAGCMTQSLFQMESFAAEISHNGPYITRNNGTGIGFDQLLETQKWYQVKTL